MQLVTSYGAGASGSAAADESGGFSCRFAVPSPCPGASGTGHWSQHAYGLAIDSRDRPVVAGFAKRLFAVARFLG